jgi:hypothetical protein
MPPSRTSSVASSHRRYEGDVESSDDLHEVDSPIDERPLPHANRNKKHELGDVTPRPPLRGFASSEKVLPAPVSAPASSLPSIHSAPSFLPTAAAPSSIPAPLELVPTAVTTAAAPNSAPAAGPRVGTSPAPRPLVPFHHEDATLWPYPRAPLDDRDDIVELDFADTSALSDVDAFEQRRRTGKNGRGGVKSSMATKKKKDREREREDIERSWDVPVPGNVVNNAGMHVVLGRPLSLSQQQQESLTGARVNATCRPADVPCPSPHPQSGVVLETNQTQTTPAAATTNNDNKSKSKSKAKAKAPVATSNGSSNDNNNNHNNAKAARGRAADATPTSNGGAGGVPALALAKSTASTAIVEAMYAHSNGNVVSPQPLPKTDRNDFVREVLTLIHVSCSLFFLLLQSCHG